MITAMGKMSGRSSSGGSAAVMDLSRLDVWWEKKQVWSEKKSLVSESRN